MTNGNEDVVRGVYDGFSRGDTQAVRAGLHDDVVFHVPGRHQLSGDYHGPVEVFEFFTRQRELTGGTIRVEVHDVLANDEHAVGLVIVHAEREGRSLEATAAHVIHMAEGKVAELWIQPGDQHAVDEFWS